MLLDSLLNEALALDETNQEFGGISENGDNNLYNLDDDGISHEDRDINRLVKNREHAKNSRLRKKNLLQAMETRLENLQYEAFNLKAELERKLDKRPPLSPTSDKTKSTAEQYPLSKGHLIEKIKQYVREEKNSIGKRKFDEPTVLENAETTCFGLKDEQGTTLSSAHTSESDLQDKSKKERNKEHAKLARDRKKLFIEKLKQTIANLEETNNRMRLHLQFLSNPQDAYISTNITSPYIPSTVTSDDTYCKDLEFI